MKYLFFTFLFVITNLSFSQGKEIVIIDASSQNPIPFCSVDFLNNDGAFSNEQGIFLINLGQVNKIKVTHLSNTLLLSFYELPILLKHDDFP